MLFTFLVQLVCVQVLNNASPIPYRWDRTIGCRVRGSTLDKHRVQMTALPRRSKRLAAPWQPRSLLGCYPFRVSPH